MCHDNVEAAMKKYKRQVLKSDLYTMKELLEETPDNCYEEFMSLSIKGWKRTHLLFSVIGVCRSFGLNRFFIGDKRAGLFRIVFTFLYTCLTILSLFPDTFIGNIIYSWWTAPFRFIDMDTWKGFLVFVIYPVPYILYKARTGLVFVLHIIYPIYDIIDIFTSLYSARTINSQILLSYLQDHKKVEQ